MDLDPIPITDEERIWVKRVKQGLRRCPKHKGFSDCYDKTGKCSICGGYQTGRWYLKSLEE